MIEGRGIREEGEGGKDDCKRGNLAIEMAVVDLLYFGRLDVKTVTFSPGSDPWHHYCSSTVFYNGFEHYCKRSFVLR